MPLLDHDRTAADYSTARDLQQVPGPTYEQRAGIDDRATYDRRAATRGLDDRATGERSSAHDGSATGGNDLGAATRYRRPKLDAA